MRRRVFLFICFGCIGLTAEIFFTAISELVMQVYSSQPIDWSLTGQSYIWMFPIYGSIAFFLPVAQNLLDRYPLFTRLIGYTILIFTVEYFSGWLLDLTTGACPWEYSGQWAVHGYIRLDYAPIWLLFSYAIEQINELLERLALYV